MTESGCWAWGGYLVHNGYGQTSVEGERAYVHRLTYQWFVGSIPSGLQIDHLCRNRACCNPDHLEPVTSAENTRRGWWANRTHCKRGHELTPENYRQRKRQRVCVLCEKERIAKFYSKYPGGQAGYRIAKGRHVAPPTRKSVK